MKILKDSLRVIQDNCEKKHNKVTVIVAKDMLEHTFGERRINVGSYVFVLTSFLNTDITLVFIRNKLEDKIRIEATATHIPFDKKGVFKKFESQTGISRELIIERVKVITGLAVATVTEGAISANIYNKNEYKKNIIVSLSSRDLYEKVPMNEKEHMSEFEQKVEYVFGYFWFNFPNDITGRDEEIIKFSLEEWDNIN